MSQGLKSDAKADSYREPNRVCATCGRPTAQAKYYPGGFGDFHHDRRRDERGRLIVRAA